MSLLPLSIGVSIFRYRLYDIDVIINRTLVYGTMKHYHSVLALTLLAALLASSTPASARSGVAAPRPTGGPNRPVPIEGVKRLPLKS